ncbi:hypothetical protein KKC45_00710 [Patescibacteria group bacterium]|nr:hypothetical protein [Patescibacteria group bacterium]
MSKYILNRNQQDSKSGGNYELHNENGNCIRLPNHENRLDVGYFDNCRDAKAQAKTKYPSMSSDIDGCYYCCNSCHNE